MPVVVTGADQPLGRAVALELAASDGEVRATVRDRGAVGALRAAGIRVAVSDLCDPGRLGAVLEGAHTVLHLDRGEGGDGSPGDTWEWLLEAAEGTDLQRIVTVLPQPTTLPLAQEGEREYELIIRQLPAGGSDRPGYPDPALVHELVEADRRAE
ncbi:NAD(P)H-binding protein [Embleya sp. NPDC050493]|uniref:NAD(P)H-binding protein n=1 Tax=Embleya sp. NPDC050493 TaxID=3363989 RepID=UPI0037953694